MRQVERKRGRNIEGREEKRKKYRGERGGNREGEEEEKERARE